jgi:hypothetical protein
MATKNTEQDLMKTGFELWKKYTQSYADLALEAMQESIQQGMSMREQMDQVMVEALKKAQELSQQEQEMLLEVTEKFQEQVKAATEQFGKMSST